MYSDLFARARDTSYESTGSLSSLLFSTNIATFRLIFDLLISYHMAEPKTFFSKTSVSPRLRRWSVFCFLKECACLLLSLTGHLSKKWYHIMWGTPAIKNTVTGGTLPCFVCRCSALHCELTCRYTDRITGRSVKCVQWHLLEGNGSAIRVFRSADSASN